MVQQPHQVAGNTFSHQIRDIHKYPDLTKETPGAGNYNPEIQKVGTSKSFLGGRERSSPDKDNGIPGPGTHEPRFPKEAPSWSIQGK